MFPQSKAFLVKEYKASSFHSDCTGRLSLPALFSLFQEMAWEHATLNNFGYEHLHSDGLFWALSRVRVEIQNIPKWGEQFTLATWASGTEGLFALRDYQVNSSDGKKLLGATSSWLIVDMKTRRPQRLVSFKETITVDESLRATSANAQKIPNPSSQMAFGIEVNARNLDIDVNGHINNTKYIEWAVNAFPLKLYRDLNVKEMEINFLAEGFCNDSLRVMVHQESQQQYSIALTRNSDSRQLTLLQLTTYT